MNGLIQEACTVISPQAESCTSWVQPSPDSLCSTCLPLQWNMRHAELARDHSSAAGGPEHNAHDNSTHYTFRQVHRQLQWSMRMHACVFVFVYMLVCDIVWSCVGLCICVLSQTSAEEPRPLINGDEWLKIVSPTPLSLSESFYLTLLGILPCDVASLLLS